MDLIYAKNNKSEEGVIKDYTLDLAYGYSENNFELTIPQDSIELNTNQFIYYNDTEYGGIIDSVYIDTRSKIKKYSGRTWHGILDSKVITPIGDYRILNGSSYSIISSLLIELDLDELFEMDTESNFVFNNVAVPRYIPFYSGLQALLLQRKGKMKLRYDATKQRVLISMVSLSDLTNVREWSEDIFNYTAKSYKNSVNHLICLGSGELSSRNVISLYTDTNGIVQPYSIVDEPKQDSDYILNSTNQVITGIDEVVEVYDYGNVSTVENYIPLTSIPEDWENSYVNYYEKQADGSYTQLQKEYDDIPTLLTTIPSDWNTYYECQKYYEKQADGKYVNVQMVETLEGYVRMWEKPEDWNSNYSDYYEYYSDGLTEEYKHPSKVNYYDYKEQVVKPSDWDDNKRGYYILHQNFEYTYNIKTKKDGKWSSETKTYQNQIALENTSTKKVTLVKSKKTSSSYITVEKYLKDVAHTKSIKWEPKKFYTRVTESKPPIFSGGKYYYASKSVTAPTFVANKYYSIEKDAEKIPAFITGKIFEKVSDNYFELVQSGIDRLNELWNQDTMETALEQNVGDFDVNDLVGNIELKSFVTKKIIKYTNNILQVGYITGKGGK